MRRPLEGSRVKLRAAWLTNVGKRRTNNEDGLLAVDRLVAGRSDVEPETAGFEGERLLFVVADGVGGAQKGEVASGSTLATFLDGRAELSRDDGIRTLVDRARERLNEHVRANPASRGMGTALAGLLFAGTGAVAFNCGDCRVYRGNGGFLERLTRDHSLVQKLVDLGEIPEEAMRTHPRKNVITSAVVGDLSSDPPELYSRTIECAPGQIYLAVSDGVWESFDHAVLEGCVGRGGTVAQIAARIRDEVLAGECRDNFTLIVVEVAA